MSSGENKAQPGPNGTPLFPVRVSGRKWLTESTFELRLERPWGFTFLPGQKVKLIQAGIDRSYSLINADRDKELAICVRHIPQGRMSPWLAKVPLGLVLHVTPAFGCFVFQPSPRCPVFVATGTGIAPFVAFARSGVRGYYLLHGVRRAEELYYHDLLTTGARACIPCISRTAEGCALPPEALTGRVTAFLENRLAPGSYDFYLCGRAEMVRDAIRIIDRRFPSALVFTETFF
jgi:benzoate/toluate 1,2-dioxygenase reductase component